MEVIIRTYHGKGTRKLFDVGEQHETELQSLMRAVPGLVSFTLARNDQGGFSVTICQNQQGIEQSVKIARDFMTQHAPDACLAAMHISEGKVITHLQQ